MRERERIDSGFYGVDQDGEFHLDPRYVQIDECETYYFDYGEIVGASNGRETQYVLIKWGARGQVHGRPITAAELKNQYRVTV